MAPKRQVHWWTTQERHMVFILYTEYNQSNEECSRLFCHHFGHLFPTAPNAERIRDEFASRDEPTRSKMWERQIERTTYTQQQETERAQARVLIQTAAQATAITLRPVGGAAIAAQPAPAPAVAPVPPTTAANLTNTTGYDGHDTSSELSSPPASTNSISSGTFKANRHQPSPTAQPISATQGVIANAGEATGSGRDKRKRAMQDEDDDAEAMSDQDTDEEDSTPQPALGSRSGLVRTPVPPNKSKTTRTTSKKAPTAKKQRTTRQTVRDEDKNRNARPGFPEKYGHVYRNELPANSRLLKLLDRRHAENFWKDEVVGNGAGERAVEKNAGENVKETAEAVPVHRTPLLRQTANQAAKTVFARVRAMQIANGTITEDEPVQIFKPAAAATLAAADLDQDEDVVMGDDE